MYLRVDEELDTLEHLQRRRHWQAGDGGWGRGDRMQGAAGGKLEVPVPVGTRVWRVNGEKILLADLVEEGQVWWVVGGGAGGRGNAHFVTPINRAPLLAEAGEPGEQVRLFLELLLVADVALIGQPNAGRSTLLSRMSAARPKVAAYPFTTLEPVRGVVEAHDKRVVAIEVPGLVQEAHAGRGLGARWLRHALRTRVVVYVIDASGDDPLGAYRDVRREVELFDAALAQRPAVVAANKVDLPGAALAVERLQRQISPSVAEVVPIVAETGQGVDGLLSRVVELLDGEATGERVQPSVAEVWPQQIQPRVRRGRVGVTRSSDGTFVVQAPEAERMVRGTNLREWRARVQLWHYLRRLGVVQALEEAGAGTGAIVRLGDAELEWQ